MAQSIPHDGFVLLVASDGLGRGDDDLGKLLLDRFLHEIGGTASLPETVIFMNAGVKLVVEASPALEQLRHLDEAGVDGGRRAETLEKYCPSTPETAGASGPHWKERTYDRQRTTRASRRGG